MSEIPEVIRKASHKCPPHKFRAAWQAEDKGVLYCRSCGEVRPLEEQTISAVDLEKIASAGTD